MSVKKAIYLTFFIFIIGILAYGYRQVYRKQEYQISLNFEYGKNIREELSKINTKENKLFWLYLRYFHQGGKDIKAGYYEFQGDRSEEHTSELQSRQYLVCRLLLE